MLGSSNVAVVIFKLAGTIDDYTGFSVHGDTNHLKHDIRYSPELTEILLSHNTSISNDPDQLVDINTVSDINRFIKDIHGLCQSLGYVCTEIETQSRSAWVRRMFPTKRTTVETLG